MGKFFNGLLRKRAKASRMVYISRLNLFERSLNWVNFMGPLASEITLPLPILARIEF